jgi:predicted nucleic acid-binding protein
MNYLWDTNIAIYYLQQQFPESVEAYIDTILKENQPALSVITEIELLSWKTETESDLEIIKGFLNDSVVIELDYSIKTKTAELRKTIGIKLPDAIIAATASIYGLTLFTRNIRDFSKCPNLKIINPFDH